MTSPPRLHSSCVQKGPGRRRVKSRTVMPSRAAGTAAGSRGRGIKVRAGRPCVNVLNPYGTIEDGGVGVLLKSKQYRVSDLLLSSWQSPNRKPSYSAGYMVSVETCRMREAVIVGAVRTPIGKRGGALK